MQLYKEMKWKTTPLVMRQDSRQFRMYHNKKVVLCKKYVQFHFYGQLDIISFIMHLTFFNTVSLENEGGFPLISQLMATLSLHKMLKQSEAKGKTSKILFFP